MSADLPVVFLVEDEETFIEALEIGLKREGFRVHVARDGAEALAMFEGVKADIVLLDVMLPKISGTDVCREIRKKSQVPIIMVSAKGSEIDTVVGLEVGSGDKTHAIFKQGHQQAVQNHGIGNVGYMKLVKANELIALGHPFAQLLQWINRALH